MIAIRLVRSNRVARLIQQDVWRKKTGAIEEPWGSTKKKTTERWKLSSRAGSNRPVKGFNVIVLTDFDCMQSLTINPEVTQTLAVCIACTVCIAWTVWDAVRCCAVLMIWIWCYCTIWIEGHSLSPLEHINQHAISDVEDVSCSENWYGYDIIISVCRISADKTPDFKRCLREWLMDGMKEWEESENRWCMRDNERKWGEEGETETETEIET